MSLTAYIGIGAGVLALIVVIQTLRLRSAKKALAAAEKRADDAWKAQEAAQARIIEEKAIAEKLAKQLQDIDDAEVEALRLIAAEKAKAERGVDEVKDAKGDSDAVLRVVGDVLDELDEGGAVSEEVPGPRSDG